MKHLNTKRGQNAKFVNDVTGGTYCGYWTFNLMQYKEQF